MNKFVLSVLYLAGLVVSAFAAEPNTLTAEEQSAGWQLLFDGRSLDGWKPSDAPGTFSVRNGEIVVHGPKSHLYYVGPVHDHDFKDFELSADVMTFPQANSGVYFHTRWQEQGWPEAGYEVQVNNSHRDPKRTAGLYDVKDNYDAVAKDGAWFTLTIRVEGKHVVTAVDGKVVVDFTEPEAWTPPTGHAQRRISHGTFAIQGHDPGSEIHYRNVKVRPLPAMASGAASGSAANGDNPGRHSPVTGKR
ncbi:MAG: glycosyl hydrolase [Verrucomicrobia bacterium]|nr:glycosyl hydrolase [Verrucomicrobiota bacterium]